MGLQEILQICLVTIFLVLNFGGVRGARGALSQEDDLELERQLKLLNKPPRKVIKDVDGTIFDCVDIDKQPALDHPLLKNHKIQAEPPPLHQEKDNATTPPFVKHVEIGIKGEECPQGTVIIRRTRKEDLLWAKSHPNVQYRPGYHYAIATVQDPARKYNGVRGSLNIYMPYVKPTQISEGMIMIEYLSPPRPDFNGIRAGWTVQPSLYGDTQTRLFGHWTADSQGSGCYNMLCPGFVQISRNITFGMLLQPSVYKKPYQLMMDLYVAKNAQSGDWWLYFSGMNLPVGYWPKTLFTVLADHGTTVHWGGQVNGPPNDSPPMGSGHFTSGGLMYASMIGNMQIVDESNDTVDVDDKTVTTYSSSRRCYDVVYRGYQGKGFRRLMYFGGPGGNCEG